MAGWTLLHLACLIGDVELVELLLQKLRQRDEERKGNLKYLDMSQKVEKLLLEHKAEASSIIILWNF